ncbi:MAG: copper resistance protein B, partial [Sphingomicrobium sp.]
MVKKPVAKRTTVKKTPAQKPVAADPHAGHDMSAMPNMPDMPEATPDAHAGHDMSTMSDAAPTGTDLPAGNAPPPPVPTDRAADAVYGAEAMAMGRHHLMQF